MEDEQSIFYLNARGFSPEKWEEICRDAHYKCNNWWVDILPKWHRIQIEMSLDEILKYLYTERYIHFSVIHRRTFERCLEIGFCTMGRKDKDGDIFLWIILDEKHIPYFIEKYNLTKQP